MLPLAGIAFFVLIYFYASTLYAGSTRFDHSSTGYDHLFNFWCDLLDPVTYNGLVNPSRPFAAAALVGLILTLISFWYFVAELYPTQKKLS